MLPTIAAAYLCIVTVAFQGQWQGMNCGRYVSLIECERALRGMIARPNEQSARVRVSYCTNDKPAFWED